MPGARLVTAEEFERIPNDPYHYELVRGRVVRLSPPGSRHAVLATRISLGSEGPHSLCEDQDLMRTSQMILRVLRLYVCFRLR